MKNISIIILAVALVISITSCKEKVSETLPREAYSGNTEGLVVRSAPDAKSQMVTTIPFAEKITITENSDKLKPETSTDKTRWYKTEWKGKSGWVQESSLGEAESVIEQIKVSFNEQKANFTDNFKKAFESEPVTIKERYIYPGGEMDPSKIFFLSSGIMVLNSKIFTENFSNTFFQYEFMNENKLIKIRFIDSKLNFDEYSELESASTSVFKIDKNDRSIIYHNKNNNFFFFNWGFHKE